jgi:hypothetical protein
MTKTIILAAMMVVMAAGSAMAKPKVRASYGQSVYCATREAGNPHSQYCDYQAWSEWRRWGSWDPSLDNACRINPNFVPSECGGRF